MMHIPFYQVDAFTQTPFSGNPAAVVPLEQWLPDDVLQSIAMENNLSETAFFVPDGDRFHLRWFTPEVEIDLCGHATLASACVLHDHLGFQNPRIEFDSGAGRLVVERVGDKWILDFPSRPPRRLSIPDPLGDLLGQNPVEVHVAVDMMAVLETEEEVRECRPDFARMRDLDARALIITAPGRTSDFVSRFFAPAVGIAEDPVTGSAHCTLIPYWAARLKKKVLYARQVSRRGGELFCELRNDRVAIGGHAVTVIEGTFHI